MNSLLFLFQVEPQEISEHSFWVKANENKYENPDLLSKLRLTFGTQMKGKCLPLIGIAFICNFKNKCT